MKVELNKEYIDDFSNEVVKVTELTNEPNYVKIEGKDWSKYTNTSHLKEFHYSDCAVHNMPMMANGKCNCAA